MKYLYRVIGVVVFTLLLNSLCNIVYYKGYWNGVGKSTVKEVAVPYYVVEATTYNAVTGQCDSTPFITASGKKIDPRDPSKHKYLALSRDLLKLFKYGDSVVVSGTGAYDGTWVVADAMNKRFNSRVDFLINERDKGGKWSGILLRKK